MLAVPDWLKWDHDLAPRHAIFAVGVLFVTIGYWRLLPAMGFDSLTTSLLVVGALGTLGAAVRCSIQERMTLLAWSVLTLIASFFAGVELLLIYEKTSMANMSATHLEAAVMYTLATAAFVVTIELFLAIVGGILRQALSSRWGGGGSGSTPEERILTESEFQEGGFNDSSDLKRIFGQFLI